MSTSSGVAGSDVVEAAAFCVQEGGASASARLSTSNALNLVRSPDDALALVLIEEDAGNGNEELEERPLLNLGGKLRLRRKSGGTPDEDAERPFGILLGAEPALAAGVGGTPRRPMRKPRGAL